MNGAHDMGGQQDMGPVEDQKNEPVFHAPWEGRIYALHRAMRAWAKWNLDADRHALELMPPADYLRMSYYERWVHRLAAQVVKYGLVSKEEMDSGKAAPGSTKATPVFTLATSASWFNRGIPSSQDPTIRPSFKVRQRVRARNINPTGHTRLPRYVARQDRRHRPGSRGLSLPRQQRAFSRREAPARLLRPFHGHRTLGGRRVAPRLGAPRSLGRLP